MEQASQEFGHLKTRPLSLRSEVVPAWLLLAFYSDLLLTIFNTNPLSILKEQKYSLKCIEFVVNRYLRRSALIVDSPEILILLSFRIKDVISIWVRQQYPTLSEKHPAHEALF